MDNFIAGCDYSHDMYIYMYTFQTMSDSNQIKCTKDQI